jgi:hypothetical protein
MPEEISGGYDIARCQSFHIVTDIGQYFFGILIPSKENQDLIHIIKP